MPKATKTRRATYAPRGGVRFQVNLQKDLYDAVSEAAESAGVTRAHYVARRLQDAFDRDQRLGEMDLDHLLKDIEGLFEKYLGDENGGGKSGGWRRWKQTDQSALTADVLTAISGLHVQVAELAAAVEDLALAQSQPKPEPRSASASIAEALSAVSGQGATSSSNQQLSSSEDSRTDPAPSYKPSF